MSDTISLTDPAIILAGIKQFGLAPDGSDLRDLAAAVDRKQQSLERMAGDVLERNQRIAVLETEIGRARADLAALSLCEPGFLDRVLRERDALRTVLIEIRNRAATVENGGAWAAGLAAICLASSDNEQKEQEA